jgi:Sec-independent protein translocase protein TatA
MFMGFYGLNLVSCFIIFLIALLLFGPKYLHKIIKDLNASRRDLAKYLSKQENQQLDDNKPEPEKDITGG